MSRSVGVWFPTIRAGTGVDRFTESLVEALHKRGIRAEISWLPHRAEYLPWSVPVPPCPDWASIVHVNSWLDRRFVPKTIPYVVTIHSCVHDKALLPYKSALQRLYHRAWVYRQESILLESASSVVAVSEYTAKESREAFKRPIHVIPNWVDGEIFRPAPDNVRREKFQLLFAGGLSRRKGKDLLPAIMRNLGEEFELLYTGRPDDFNQDLPGNMTPVGTIRSREEMAALYSSCDALLLPTRLEGLPLVVLEAMACGLPVIATNCSSLPEVIQDQVNGLLCPIDDVEGFAQKARMLRAHPDWRARMSLAARNVAANEFSPNALVSEYVRVYEEVLSSRSGIDNNREFGR